MNAALHPQAGARRRLVLGYAGLALVCLLLFAAAGTDWQRGTRTLWDGLYDAVWNLGPPLLLGLAVWPVTKRLQSCSTAAALAGHLAGALAFVLAWLLLDWGSAALFFGLDHANASAEQGLAWRAAGGVFGYGAMVAGFGGVLHARQAQAAALQAAQAERDAARAQAALVRAELALIQGKLNPHFLFNTLNSLLMLTRRDPGAAESALHTFSRLMRYVLDRSREPEARVELREELAFVRDYLSLEQLRLGERLRLAWAIAP
ncbi:MAG: histidine kinase, partial [Burkholderiales bacterium]|nr:histidine kinase [Burkholderiales bacterium]